jgi:hypothetical protein
MKKLLSIFLNAALWVGACWVMAEISASFLLG